MPTSTFVKSLDIEQKTSFSNDLLRKWRERYGFPLLERNEDGQAGYSSDTVEHLLLIKRLLESGLKPSRVVGKSLQELNRMRLSLVDDLPTHHTSQLVSELIKTLKQIDIAGFTTLLADDRANGTLTEFIINTVAPLIEAIGTVWSRGEIEIYHEHLATSIIKRYLQAEILTCKHKPNFPAIIFSTPPGELHSLGLLMTEAVLAEQGAKTIDLGSNIPLNDLKLAAISCQADIIAMSFSFAYPVRRAHPVISHLRHILPTDIQIWIGGNGLNAIRSPKKGVHLFTNLADAVDSLHEFNKNKVI